MNAIETKIKELEKRLKNYDQRSARVEVPSVTEFTAKEAYRVLGIGPEDLDLAEFQDTCSWNEIENMELLGFCKPGEAGPMIEQRKTFPGSKMADQCQRRPHIQGRTGGRFCIRPGA